MFLPGIFPEIPQNLSQSAEPSRERAIESLAAAIERKDRYTGGHTKRVAHYAARLCRALGMSAAQVELVRIGALLHDVGKIGVDDRILKKSSPLDEVEWREMLTHPELGFGILSQVEALRDVSDAIRFHHERWDGRGYPLGLQGEGIPLAARIIAVADTYDAMVSTRPYRKGLARDVAYAEILRQSGAQFDPRVVEAFAESF